MNPEQENFEALRKLMALKRHEIPPPGYFDHLPRRISTRLRSDEGMPTFWDSFIEKLRSNVSVAYAFSLTACGALAMTIVYGARIQSVQAATAPADSPVSWAHDAVALTDSEPQTISQGLHVITYRGDTNPAAQPYQLPSLFAHTMQPATLPTAYEAIAQ